MRFRTDRDGETTARRAGRWRPPGAFSHVLTLASGTLVAQLLPLLLSPLLTRIYSPTEFGQFAFWLAVITVAAPLATMRYDQAIITADSEQIPDLIRICFAMSVGWSLVGIGCALWFAEASNSPLASAPAVYAWLLPVGIFLTAQFNTLYSLNTRQENYKLLARATAQRSGAIGIAQVFLGWVRNGGPGLIIGQVLGQLVALSSMSRAAVAALNSEGSTSRSDRYSSAVATARANRKFPAFSTPAALANELALQLFPLLATPLYGMAALGHYALVQRMLATPSGVIGSAIGQVYFRNIAEQHRNGSPNRRLFLATTGQLIAVGIPLFAVAWLISPWAFHQAFGQSWQEAGDYARILSFVFFARFVVMGVSSTAVVHQRQAALLIWQVSLLAGTAAAIAIAATASLSFESYLTTYSWIAGVHYFILWAFLYYQVSRPAPER